MLAIREERPGDEAAVRAVNGAAFGQATEGAIVDLLRMACNRLLSLVALDGDCVLGHILFSPVDLRGESGKLVAEGMGLAPMAVSPLHQRRGIGSKLVREGLARLRALQVTFVVVLGHPEFYPRFGFERASKFGVRCPWEVPDEAFMLLPLNALPSPVRGCTAYYRKEFDAAV